MSVVRNYRYQIVEGKAELFVTPEPQFIESIEGEVDLQQEYIDVLNTPFEEMTAEQQLRFEQYQDIIRNFRLPGAKAKVTLDTTDITNIDALGRSQAIEQAEQQNNINYTRELVFLEGAANTPGTIELPCDDYDTVYIINDDNTIEFIDPYNEVDNSTRPYYIKADGKTTIYVNHFSGGSGTQADPYLIETLQELQDIRSVAPNGSYVALANDIDASDTVNWNGGAGFIPLSSYNDGHWGVNFDGQGHKISNLYMNSSGDYRVGLMGYVDTDITIKNVFLENVDINSTSPNVGAFIGYVDRFNTINFEKCAVTGSVTYSGGAGGTTIGNGGFVGYQQFSAIKAYNSFFRGTIDDANIYNNTRIFGSESRSTHIVEHSYFAGTMPGKTQADPLSAGGTYLKSYYNNEVQTYTSNYAEIIGMTTAQMRSQSNYVGWDFTNTWTIDPAVNDGYPIQQIFYSGSSTETYSGGSEVTVSITPEGSYFKTVSGAAESTVSVQAEGAYQLAESYSGGSESTNLISTETGALKSGRSPPAETNINVDQEGNFEKLAAGSSESQLNISSEGQVKKLIAGGLENSIVVTRESAFKKIITDSSESLINVGTEGTGAVIEEGAGGTFAQINITDEGLGFKTTAGGSESSLSVTIESKEFKTAAGGSESTILITAEGAGEGNLISAEGGSESNISITAESAAKKNTASYSEADLIISEESLSKKLISDQSETETNISNTAYGFKHYFGGSNSYLTTDTEGDYLKTALINLESAVEIKGFSSIYKITTIRGISEAKIEIDAEIYLISTNWNKVEVNYKTWEKVEIGGAEWQKDLN